MNNIQKESSFQYITFYLSCSTILNGQYIVLIKWMILTCQLNPETVHIPSINHEIFKYFALVFFPILSCLTLIPKYFLGWKKLKLKLNMIHPLPLASTMIYLGVTLLFSQKVFHAALGNSKSKLNLFSFPSYKILILFQPWLKI